MDIKNVLPKTAAEKELHQQFNLFPSIFNNSNLVAKVSESDFDSHVYTISELKVQLVVKFTRMTKLDVPVNFIKNPISGIAVKVLLGSLLGPLSHHHKVHSMFMIVNQVLQRNFDANTSFVYFGVHDKNRSQYLFYHNERTGEAVAIVLENKT